MIDQAKRLARNGLLFPSVRGGFMSDMSLSRMMERREMEARPHGFRSSLRVFLAEKGCPRDIGEMILAHSVLGKVEASYMRSDLLDIRRGWMDRWARFVVTGKDEIQADVPTTGGVVELRAAG